MKLLHKIKHFFGWNTGRVWSVIDKDGLIWIGFKCDECGDINHVHTNSEPPKDN